MLRTLSLAVSAWRRAGRDRTFSLSTSKATNVSEIR